MAFKTFSACLVIIALVVTVGAVCDPRDRSVEDEMTSIKVAWGVDSAITLILGICAFVLACRPVKETTPPTYRLISSYPIVENLAEYEKEFWIRAAAPMDDDEAMDDHEVAIILVDEGYRVEEWEKETTQRQS